MLIIRNRSNLIVCNDREKYCQDQHSEESFPTYNRSHVLITKIVARNFN